MKKKRKPTVKIVWLKRPTIPRKQVNLDEYEWINIFQNGEVQNFVKCWKCQERYQPKAEDLKRWAESGTSFDPTDWECPSCEAAEGEHP